MTTKTGKSIRTGKRVFALLMVFACMFTAVSDYVVTNAAAASEQSQQLAVPDIVGTSDNALWVDGSSYSKNNSLDAIKWHYESREGRYYLYLPSSADLEHLTIWHSFSNTLYVNGTKVENGETTNVFANAGKFTLKAGSAEYKLTVMKSENINTMFITTKSGNLDAVNASKSNKDSGEIVYVDKKGKAQQVGLDQIKGRGNSSWEAAQKLFYKYPYNIKLSSKTKLFGMAKSKKWCLLANDFDQSLIRNKFVFDLAEDAGLAYTPDSEFADVYQNGRYIGNYLVTSKVEVDSNRVDIYDLEGATEDVNSKALEDYSRGGTTSGASAGTYKYYNIPNNPEDITGGYLLEFELDERYPDEASGFVSSRRQQVVMKSPEFASKAQVEYIRDYYQKMENAVYSADGYNSDGVYYTDYLDIESAAKMYIIEELTMENDANATSFYCYKDTNDKIHFGPAWDFDWGIGGYNRKELLDTNYLYVQNKTIYNNKTQKCFLAALCTHADFMAEVARVWEEDFYPLLQVSMGEKTAYSDNVLSIAQYGALVEASANMNFNKFKFLGTTYWGSTYTGSTFAANVEYVNSFVKKRIAFLDSYFKGLSKESTFYFDNTAAKWSNVYAYVWDDNGKTVVQGNLIDASNQIYKFKVTGPYSKVIFKNTDGTTSWNIQTTDLVIPTTEKNCYKPNTAANKSSGYWYAYTEGNITPTPTEIPSNNTVTLYYNSGWTNAYVHYKVNGTWTTVPGKKMQATTEYEGYTYKCTIDLANAESATVCFNNGNGSWDSKNGANYTVMAGWYGVSNGVVKKLEPLTIISPEIPIATATPTPTATATPTVTAMPTVTATPTVTAVPTVTATPTVTVTPTVIPTVTPTPVLENKVTVYYNNSNWSKAYIHYNVNGSWTNVPGMQMQTSDVSGYAWKYTIDLGNATSAFVCFNNGNNVWDSKNGANYVVGSGDYGVKNGVVTKLNLTYNTTLSADTKTGIVGKKVSFTANTVNGVKPYTYDFEIMKNDEKVVSETTQDNVLSWTPLEEGNYHVIVVVTDASGKKVTAEIVDFKVKTTNTITVYYKNSNWSKAYIHYKVDGVWTSVPGVQMQSSDVNGYTWMYSIEIGDASNVVACFNNGSGSWDSKNGSNYVLSEERVGITNGNIYVLD